MILRVSLVLRERSITQGMGRFPLTGRLIERYHGVGGSRGRAGRSWGCGPVRRGEAGERGRGVGVIGPEDALKPSPFHLDLEPTQGSVVVQEVLADKIRNHQVTALPGSKARTIARPARRLLPGEQLRPVQSTGPRRGGV
jgi:hypothetical protein